MSGINVKDGGEGDATQQRGNEGADDAGLPEHAHDFHTRQRRMRYQEFRKEGYPIGSGKVESGIKQFKARLSGPGMRWSRPGAEKMLAIRSAVMADTFDHLWETA
jgi:hypothetical protein